MKGWAAAIGAIAIILVAGLYVKNMSPKTPGASPTPTLAQVSQLPLDKQPEISLVFSKDAHEVKVAFANLNADKLEYNLIYEASITSGGRTNRSETGVYGEETITGKSTYSATQLLGSESSGKRTYHENIDNARLELTLRDAQGRSVFTATYPFEVKAGAEVELEAAN